MSTEGTIPAEELAPSVEQQVIRTVEDEHAVPEVAAEPEAAPKPAEPKAEEAPKDPRAARMEQLAERRRDNVADEIEAVQQVMAPTPAAAPEPVPAPVPERMIKLKVRGEIVELPESEVIARAQKVDAADQYLQEARTVLDDAKRVVREPQPAPMVQAQPTPAAEKVDNVAKAIELIQTGGDPAEVRALLETDLNQRAEEAASRVVDNRSVEQRGTVYDQDFNGGFAAAATEYSDLMGNPVGRSTVTSLAGALQAHVIAEHLTQLAPEVQQAFSASGITPDSLKNYSPEDAGALYKDMLLKGYRLPRPSEVIKAASKTVADFYAGSTKPAPALQPEPNPNPQPVLDRSARKEALVQPERTAIPKSVPRPAPPRSEAQRATSARQEMRGSRRRGATG